MPNDKTVSKLISKSLSGDLSQHEADELNKSIGELQKSQSFRDLSKVIQDSISELGSRSVDGDSELCPPLSGDAKERLRKSVALEIVRKSKGQTSSDPDESDSFADSDGSPKNGIALETSDNKVSSTDPTVQKAIAFAAAVLESNKFTESQFQKIVSGWNQKTDLGQYLLQQGLIEEGQLEEFKIVADQKIAGALEQTMVARGSWDIHKPESVSRLSSLIGIGRNESANTEIRQTASRFKLIRKLADGGLGTVWLARDERLKRSVAIKEMNEEALESPIAWQRFLREAEITGHLEHPNVVPLYQSGSDPNTGTPFYSMRFVGKRTLSDAIEEYHEMQQSREEDPLQLHQLLSAFLGVCQAIAYAHSRGVVHRDLKPDNIALDKFGQVVVLDWGLAKLSEQHELNHEFEARTVDIDYDNLQRTVEGDFVGTPLYMSPEQAAGETDAIDERTDIYGLGAILFAILTGKAPHENSFLEDRNDRAIRDFLKKIAEGITLSPKDINPRCPAELQKICLKAMAKKNFMRYESASDLADEVQRWMAGQHEKQRQYENMRIEGRELCANLRSALHELGTNTRFMSKLPPIQQLIDCQNGNSEEDENTWRKRLSIIYSGLLQSKSSYASIGYCSTNGEGVSEIVRVERSESDPTNIRNVPISRLAVTEQNSFSEKVVAQKPGEVQAQIQCGYQLSSANKGICIRSGTPVFDQETEDHFGYVEIVCSLIGLVGSELRNRVSHAKQIFVINQESKILVHDTQEFGRVFGSVGKPAVDFVADYPHVLDHLSRRMEFVDESDRAIYATGLDLTLDSRLVVLLSLEEPGKSIS